MKYFDDKAPLLSTVRKKLIRDREDKIIEDVKRLEQLKKVNADKVSRHDLMQIFNHPLHYR
jgi:5-methylcytosine-specific restriction endonuclease McrBC regulatory subunit McrC